MIAIENTLRREGIELGEFVAFRGPAQTSNGRYAAVVEDRLVTPTQIGVALGKTARQVNLLLEDLGLQERAPNGKGGFDWVPTRTGKQFAEWIETGKRHSSGAPVTALRWKETATIAYLQQQAVVE